MHDQLHGGIPIFVRVRVHGDRVGPLKRTVQRWPECCNPIHRIFFFYFLFTKPGRVPILPGDGMRGEGKGACVGGGGIDILPGYHGCSAVLIIYKM